MTEQTQTDIFTTASRSLALIEKLLMQPHGHDPVRSSKRLAPGADRAGEEATTRNLPPCKRHKFMTSVCDTHTSFDDEEADAKFHAVNHLAKTTIGDVEVGRSRFRRRLLSASLQTHTQVKWKTSQRCGHTPKRYGAIGMQCSDTVCGTLFVHVKRTGQQPVLRKRRLQNSDEEGYI